MNKRNTTRRLLALALSFVLILGMLPLSARAASWRDGTYTGVGKGYDGDVKLSVTVRDGRIAAIETVYQKETKAFWKQAESLLDSIVSANSAEVDAVSGATHSSDGIKEAVRSALASASAEDAAPVFQSSKNYGGEKTDALHGVAFTKDGGFVAMGYSFGDCDDPQWTHVGSANNNDAILMKFNAIHELEWAKAYATDGVDVFESIDVLNDGRIVALGRQTFQSEGNSIKGVSWYLLVIDPDDPENYTDYHIGGAKGDQGFSVAATSDGGFVAAGWSASESGYLTGSTDRVNYTPLTQLWEPQDGTNDDIPNRVAPGGSDSIVVKFDKDGNLQYTAIHNYSVSENANNISSPSERLEDIAVDSQDNIYLVGYDAIAKNAQNAVIAKLNGADGSLLWHRSAGRAAQTLVPADAAEYIKAEYSGVAVLADDSVVVTGTSTTDADTEENWQVTGTKDTLAVHYSADGELIRATSFGTINDNDSRPEAILATSDGGYIIASNQSGMMHEDDRLAEGYDWGSYGGEDAVLVKYDAQDRLVWTENYGTATGDWINALAISDGELIAVGESNGSGGYPAWNNNGGGVDGIILCTNLYSAACTESALSASDGDVVWADGVYTDEGTGHAGSGSVTVTVEITDGAITSVTGSNRKDSDTYYNAASALHDTIRTAQSAEVDAVSGATHSSDGIREAARKALSQAAAAHTDALIEGITDAESAQTAAISYAELGSYAIEHLTKRDALQAAAEQYGVTLVSRVPQPITENQPVRASYLAYNDTYYKLQQQSFALVGAEAFKTSGLTGEGVKIAVLDSGVTGRHSDLDYSRILDGYDYDDDKPMPVGAFLDNNGHGTAVTGIIAAKTGNALGVAGLLDRVEIIPLKISPKAPNKDTDGASSKLVARAIREAVDVYGADVITTSMDIMETDELNEAVAYAVSKNVIITAASGNAGKAGSTEDAYVYPAACEGVISVGAVEASGVVRASSTKNDKVFVTAPGGDIVLLDLSLSGRCKIADGTSYASPVVAAMAAAAKQQNKDMTVDEFKTLLRETTVDAGDEGYDNAYGYGIVSLSALANELKPQSSENTSETTSDSGNSGSSSSSGSTPTATTITNHPDGSTTRTVAKTTELKNADGSVTAKTTETATTTDAEGKVTVVVTTREKNTAKDGTTGEVVKDENGSVLSAEAKVSEQAVREAQKSGEPVRIAMEVSPVVPERAEKAAPITITVPDGVTRLRVEIAVPKRGPSIVAMMRSASGKLIPIKDCYEGSLIVPIQSSCEIVIVDNTKTFADVSENDWFRDNVTFVTAREIFNGTGDGQFTPNAAMTRGMLAQVLYNFDRHAAPDSRYSFADASGKWYADAASWAASAGVVTGTNLGFEGDKNVTREQVAAMLYRYAKALGFDVGGSGDMSAFDDAQSVSDWALDAMRWAVGIGLINGTDGKLMPQGNATRAQLAAIMERFVENAMK